MRGILPAILGLVTLSVVHARALPVVASALEQRAADLDYTHLSDYPLDDPRNDGLAKRSPATDDDLLEAGDSSANILANREAAPPAAPRPASPHKPRPNNKPRPGQPGLQDEIEEEFTAFERRGGAWAGTSSSKR